MRLWVSILVFLMALLIIPAMAKDKLISVEDVLAKEEELVELRKQAIAQILEEREALNQKLAKLGYTDGTTRPQASVKTRKRATKEEMAARRAAQEKGG